MIAQSCGAMKAGTMKSTCKRNIVGAGRFATEPFGKAIALR